VILFFSEGMWTFPFPFLSDRLVFYVRDGGDLLSNVLCSAEVLVLLTYRLDIFPPLSFTMDLNVLMPQRCRHIYVRLLPYLFHVHLISPLFRERTSVWEKG